MQSHRDCAWSFVVLFTVIVASPLSSLFSSTNCTLLSPSLCGSSLAGTSGQSQVHLKPQEKALLLASMATRPEHGLSGECKPISCRTLPWWRSSTDLHAGPAARSAPARQARVRHRLHRLCQPCHWQPGPGCWGARDGLDTSLCQLQHSRYYLVGMCLIVTPQNCRIPGHANNMAIHMIAIPGCLSEEPSKVRDA